MSLFAHQTVGEAMLGQARMSTICCECVMNGTNRKNGDLVCDPGAVARKVRELVTTH